MLKKLGLAIPWDPDFDLLIVIDCIKRKKKYAWGCGGIVFADELLENLRKKRRPRHMYAVIKRKGMSSITIGARIDIGREFRKYLGSTHRSKYKVKPEHEIYRQEGGEHKKFKAFLFIDKIFWLKDPIHLSKLIKIKTKIPLDNISFQTPTVIDLEESKVYDLIKKL